MPTTASLDKELKSVKSDIRALREDLKELVAAVGHNGHSRWEHFRGRLGGEAAHRAEQIREGIAHLRDAGAHASEQAQETLSEHPLSSVFAALGIGVVLGRFVLGRW